MSNEIKPRAYMGYYIDDNKLNASASGGAASVFSETAINQSAIVYGVTYTDDFYGAEYSRAVDKSDIIRFRGSKYITTQKKVSVNGNRISVYKQVAEDLNLKKSVVFIGLGCDVAGILQYCKKNSVDTRKLLTIDLICHGPTLPIIQEKFIKELEEKFNSKVISFNTRFKKKGWNAPPYIKAVFQNGRVYEKPLYETDFGYAFSNYSMISCTKCNYKADNHKADITIGDYWGINTDSEEYNSKGVSVIIIHTEKGANALNSIDTSLFFIKEISYDDALKKNPMYFISRDTDVDHEVFKRLIDKNSLHYTVVTHMGRKRYIINTLKRTIKHIIGK